MTYVSIYYTERLYYHNIISCYYTIHIRCLALVITIYTYIRYIRFYINIILFIDPAITRLGDCWNLEKSPKFFTKHNRRRCVWTCISISITTCNVPLCIRLSRCHRVEGKLGAEGGAFFLSSTQNHCCIMHFADAM